MYTHLYGIEKVDQTFSGKELFDRKFPLVGKHVIFLKKQMFI